MSLDPPDFGGSAPGAFALTATGTTQADAFVLFKKLNVFSTVASGSGCKLPGTAFAGAKVEVFNRGANALKVYPGGGDQIEADGINTAFSVPAGTNCEFVSFNNPLSPPPRTWWKTVIVSASNGVMNTTSPLGYQQNGFTILNVFGSGAGDGQNLTVGYLAGAALPGTDILTTAIGYQALRVFTGSTGENTAIGWGTMRALLTGAGNTGVGVNVMGVSTVDTGNALLGQDAMRSSTGSKNAGLGSVIWRNGSHNNSVAVGFEALYSNNATTAVTTDNVAVGYLTMHNVLITTASFNTAVGSAAGRDLTTGQNNSVFGYQAGLRITTGSGNNVHGKAAGFNILGANFNTIMGDSAGSLLTSGGTNSIFGNAVASTVLTTGTGNILIGTNASTTTAAASTSNTLRIQGSGATPTITGSAINATPLVGIGMEPGSATLSVATNIAIGANQVIAARDTGWTAMTGTPNEVTVYDTATVTLPQLAGRMMALQTALTTHGLIGT